MSIDLSQISWAERIINQLGRLPIVGDWYACCCKEDLRQIADNEDLADIIVNYEENGGDFFRSKEEALQVLP